MFIAQRPGTPGTGVGRPASSTPKTSSRFEAGSVLTRSTRWPRSARPTAVAPATEVLPTPPLPVKNRFRVKGPGITMTNPPSATPALRAGRQRPEGHHLWGRAARGGRFPPWTRLGRGLDARQPSEFRALGIGPARGHPGIDEDQRQAVVAVLVQGGPHRGVGRERLGLLREVVTFDLDALTLEPVEVCGEPREDGIDRGAADAGGAAHRGIVDSKLRHGHLLCSSIDDHR